MKTMFMLEDAAIGDSAAVVITAARRLREFTERNAVQELDDDLVERDRQVVYVPSGGMVDRVSNGAATPVIRIRYFLQT